jgi:hypothetical protein
VKVQEFREAVSEAAAVDAFVNGRTPPLNPADWLGYDTGWAQYTAPDEKKQWAYNFGTSTLVQVATTPVSTSFAQNVNYRRPEDLLIYYGWLNSFNSSVNGWNNEKVAQDMARYQIVVFGAGIEDPTHPDYANTLVIVARLKEIRPDIKLFGYVATTNILTDFKTKVDRWCDLGVYGIFVDAAGYDYGTPATNGRDAFNEKIDYVHGKAHTNIVFANAWDSDHILGTAEDPSYPNSIWNPSLNESSLGGFDYVLLESFPINTAVWSPGYEGRTEWYSRAEKILGHRKTYGVNVAAVGIIDNGNVVGQDLFDFGFVSALVLTLKAWGTSDTNYGASSAAVDWWSRKNIVGLDYEWPLDVMIISDLTDANVYWRYLTYGRLKLDFTPAAQASAIEQW